MEKGLTPIRTVRMIAAIVAFAGMFVLLMQRTLTLVLVMAKEMLSLAFARYGNFTGRFAANNFDEDKKLLSMLREIQPLIPTAETALTILLVLSILLLAIALVGLALPMQSAHVLVALKILKWQPGESSENADASGLSPRAKKILCVVFGAFILAVLAGIGIHSCVENAREVVIKEASDELNSNGVGYIRTQRAYFSKHKAIGNAKQLGLESSWDGLIFSFKVDKGFSAQSKIPIGSCPAGSVWSVKPNVSGVFSKELKLYRQYPENKECEKITPDFKNIGRKH